MAKLHSPNPREFILLKKYGLDPMEWLVRYSDESRLALALKRDTRIRKTIYLS